jgi:hypothetical protein
MIYLLITTTGNKNTGDELIRIGVQNLIKEIDSNAKFILFNKNNAEWNIPDYDKAILCGMPLFFNNNVSTSQTIGWWGALFRQKRIRKKDFLCLGVGSAYEGIKDKVMFGAAIQEALDNSYAVIDRDDTHTFHPDVISSICPASFAVQEPKEPKYKLCNLMFEGAHDRHFNLKEADIWKIHLQTIAEFCKLNDFYFIEHASKPHCEDGEKLGWSKDKIIRFNTAEEYLDIYAQAECFFGNRLHGALVTASLGRPSLAIGYDSRIEMVKKIGGKVKLPSELELSDIKDLLKSPHNPPSSPLIIKEEKEKLLNILKEFIYG